jgi:DNA-binding response OmpR family regulator
VARVLALVPDLLFGSNVLGMLRAAGHEAALCGDEEALRAELAAASPQLLVLDLTDAVPERVELVGRLRAEGKLDGVRTVAFYSHVDADARIVAEEAVDVVVPRSRMAREGAAVIERALA